MDVSLMRASRPARRSFREALDSSGMIIQQQMTEPDQLQDFASATAAGLSSTPRSLQCRFLYDARGSQLFEEITRQPEYYLTRTEAGILAANANLIRKICGPTTLVELGSGNSMKTDYLLRAWLAQSQQGVTYIPVDVSKSALIEAARNIASTHPPVRVTGINSDYSGAFPLFREVSPVTVLFLGSTIGNLPDIEMNGFLNSLSQALCEDDFFLLGIDLIKDRPIIEAAYNDAGGVTEEFTRNIFRRMNRELHSAIDPSAVEHVAVYNETREQVEISARFNCRQIIRVAPLGKWFIIGEGEAINTEISRKFRLDEFVSHVEDFGFATEEIFTDERKWFALLLLRRTRLDSRTPRVAS